MHFSTQTKIKPMEVKTSNKGFSQRGKKCCRGLGSFNNLKKLKKFFKSSISLSFWLNGFCLGFVVWQTIKCMTKFIGEPKGTEISMKQSTDLPFPAITVCGNIKFTYLQNVCGIR